jgi:hypothetical protein
MSMRARIIMARTGAEGEDFDGLKAAPAFVVQFERTVVTMLVFWACVGPLLPVQSLHSPFNRAFNHRALNANAYKI